MNILPFRNKKNTDFDLNETVDVHLVEVLGADRRIYCRFSSRIADFNGKNLFLQMPEQSGARDLVVYEQTAEISFNRKGFTGRFRSPVTGIFGCFFSVLYPRQILWIDNLLLAGNQ